MKDLTLTEIIESLESAQDACLCDIQKDWNDDKEFMQFQLKILTDSLGGLRLLALSPSSKFFKSTMKL